MWEISTKWLLLFLCNAWIFLNLPITIVRRNHRNWDYTLKTSRMLMLLSLSHKSLVFVMLSFISSCILWSQPGKSWGAYCFCIVRLCTCSFINHTFTLCTRYFGRNFSQSFDIWQTYWGWRLDQLIDYWKKKKKKKKKDWYNDIWRSAFCWGHSVFKTLYPLTLCLNLETQYPQLYACPYKLPQLYIWLSFFPELIWVFASCTCLTAHFLSVWLIYFIQV